MTWSIGFTLATVAVALVLFVGEWFRIDQVALLVPGVLLVGGVLTAEEAISGFSSPATITVAAMLVMSLGLVKTGAVDALARWIRRAPLRSPRLRLMVLCAVVALLSPFLNNTAVVAVFLPVFLTLAEEADEPPSRYLIPLSYAAILGGTVTLIGTSTNLIVWGMAQNRGFTDLHLFSIAPLGLVYMGVGLAYLVLVGRWLLPHRRAPLGLPEKYGVREFLTEMRVRPGSGCAGRTLGQLDWRRSYGVSVLGIRRGDEVPSWGPPASTVLAEGDTLYVEGDKDDLMTLARREGLSTPAQDRRIEIGGGYGEDRLIEVLVPPGSRLAGHTLRELRFPLRHGATVVGIHRHGTAIRKKLSRVVLQVGDLLLVHGPADALEILADRRDFLLLNLLETPTGDRPRALVSVAILGGVVVAAALGLTSILAAAILGVLVMLFTGCVTLEEIYRELDWMVVFLLAGLLPLGIAMDRSGAGAWIVGLVDPVLEPLPLIGVVAVFYLLTSVLTEMLSNTATAVVLTPLALLSAADLGVNPYALLVAVMFGASASFMTPMGYQTNAMIYGPGGYSFTDFLRVGAPLNLLLLALASVLIPFFWM